MKTILDQIVAYKKEECASLRRRVTLKDVELKARDAEVSRPFLLSFPEGGINIIAEVKKASPSAGVIRENFNALDLALRYQDAGAVALSILTDEKFFQGSLDYIPLVKSKVALPILRKDFTLSEYHVFEARGAGADAILLIAAILDDHQLKDYQALAQELGMSVLVEVHDAKELDRALKISPRLVGVNNRDLKTFKTDLELSRKLASQIPSHIIRISESGLNTHDDLENLLDFGYRGFLIGESILREKDVEGKIRELIQG